MSYPARAEGLVNRITPSIVSTQVYIEILDTFLISAVENLVMMKSFFRMIMYFVIEKKVFKHIYLMT